MSMDIKRKAMEGALVPAKRPRNELVAIGDKENALVQSVRFNTMLNKVGGVKTG